MHGHEETSSQCHVSSSIIFYLRWVKVSQWTSSSTTSERLAVSGRDSCSYAAPPPSTDCRHAISHRPFTWVLWLKHFTHSLNHLLSMFQGFFFNHEIFQNYMTNLNLKFMTSNLTKFIFWNLVLHSFRTVLGSIAYEGVIRSQSQWEACWTGLGIHCAVCPSPRPSEQALPGKR